MNVLRIGETALRGPDGSWLESVPLYVEVSGRPSAGKGIKEDIAMLMAARRKAEDGKEAGQDAEDP